MTWPIPGAGQRDKFQPPVFEAGKYTVKVGRNRPDGAILTQLASGGLGAGTRMVPYDAARLPRKTTETEGVIHEFHIRFPCDNAD